MNKINWNVYGNGVWKSEIGQPDDLSPLSVVRPESVLGNSGVMRNYPPFPLDECEIQYEFFNNRLIINMPITINEKIYGFGLQFMKMNQRGRIRYLRVNSDPKQDTGETHAPVPFYVSTKGYGLLIDTARIITIYCGASVRMDSKKQPPAIDRNSQKEWSATPKSDVIEIVMHASGVNLYMFSGRNMLEVVQRYNLFCGGGALPPKWGLGFWHRVPTMYNSEQAYTEAMEYKTRGIPCSVIGLEPGWHSKSYPCSYEWSAERFPQPEEFVSKMKREGFRLNLWENPYISPKSEIYEKLKPLSGSHSVWAGLAPDFSLPEVQEIYKNKHLKEHVEMGVSGYKIDECDGSELTSNSWMFPAHAKFPSGNDGEQLRQIYGLSLQKSMLELFRSINIRTYGLVRASNAAASSMPFCLYSDLYDHRQFVRALCNSGFCGILWTPEVRGAKNQEDWVRRIQVVCFSPLAMLDAWADGTKPWTYPEVEHIVKKYINTRMQLLPYLYSAFARYHFEGLPPVRAMELEFESNSEDEYVDTHINSTDQAYGKVIENDLDSQYMFGDFMLVAPMFEGEKVRKVYLPNGRWYDFETGEEYLGGRFVTVTPGLEKIPIFVRDGAVIPMIADNTSLTENETDIEVRHYGRVDGEFSLYEDDGETFEYEKGKFIWVVLEVKEQEDGEWTLYIDKNKEYGKIGSYRKFILKHMNYTK